MSLFAPNEPPKPLAERLRPQSLDEVLGQEEARRLLAAYVARGQMPSIVFWGPPGSGKTTLSRLMAALLGWTGRALNATSASVKDIRDLAQEAKATWAQHERRTLLFIDEIHRLNKSRQDVLLPIVEDGTLTLAGSTTENPYFSLNGALRSRVQLIHLQPLSAEILAAGLTAAADCLGVPVEAEARSWIAQRAAGDLRLALTVYESAAQLAASQKRAVAVADAALCLNQTPYDGGRGGDSHYDLASAFQKSLRGSDADAAIYYLARFLETGEDPRFIARRLLVTASEDVGNADPQALLVAEAAFSATERLGLPECRIPLAQATLYVARAPKSNESVASLGRASALLHARPPDAIPAALRDAHYAGAKELGHGQGYLYSHDHPQASQVFLPAAIAGMRFTGDPVQKVDDEASSRLRAHLAASHAPGTWFEIDAGRLAAELNLPEPRVRQTLNELVKARLLAYKRSFKLTERDTP